MDTQESAPPGTTPGEDLPIDIPDGDPPTGDQPEARR